MEYVIKVTRLFESSWKMIQGNKVNQGIRKKSNFKP